MLSVPEMLLVAVMFAFVLTAALTPFEMLLNVDRKTQAQNDTQQNARSTVAGISFNLRNLAGQSQLVQRAAPHDLVFETVDRTAKPAGSQNSRNIMRVRYCLDTTNAPASPANGRLWEQTLRWTTAAVPASMPSTADCPDTLWAGSQRRVVADRLTNRIAGQNRALFAYFPTGAALTLITSIRLDLYSDDNPNDQTKETRHTTGVLLRNQNGAPTASATATATGVRQVRLDATASDPENLPLTYRWCDVTSNPTCDDSTRIGSGQSYTYTLDAAVGVGTTRNMRLVVTDAGGFDAIFDFSFTVPGA